MEGCALIVSWGESGTGEMNENGFHNSMRPAKVESDSLLVLIWNMTLAHKVTKKEYGDEFGRSRYDAFTSLPKGAAHAFIIAKNTTLSGIIWGRSL